MLRVERIDSLLRLDALRGAWTSLLEESQANSLFLTWEWLRTWWIHLGGPRRLAVIAIHRGEELIGLAPWALRKGRFFPKLEFLGAGIVGSDDLDLVARRGEEEAVLTALLRELERLGVGLELRGLPEGSATGKNLGRCLEAAGWQTRLERADICPFIGLKGHTWDSYLASIGPEHRANVRRRLRQLEGRADMRLEKVETEEQRVQWLSLLFALHRARWNEKGGSEAFGEPGVFEFHDAITRLALERGWLRMLGLSLDGRAAAVLYGFRYGGGYLYYQLGWDPALSRSSVGLVVLALGIRGAIEEGASVFEFLHGGEAYKYLWAKELRGLQRLEAFPPNATGLAQRHAIRAGSLCRSVARRFLGEGFRKRVGIARRLGLLQALRASLPR